MLWLDTKSVKWKLHACDKQNGRKFKRICTTKL
jgi:hypothetical protein